MQSGSGWIDRICNDRPACECMIPLSTLIGGRGSSICLELVGLIVSTVSTILRSGPYRFLFYAGDRDELVHVRVERDDSEAKFGSSVRLERSGGFGRKEINRIQAIIEENLQILVPGPMDEHSNG